MLRFFFFHHQSILLFFIVPFDLNHFDVLNLWLLFMPCRCLSLICWLHSISIAFRLNRFLFYHRGPCFLLPFSLFFFTIVSPSISSFIFEFVVLLIDLWVFLHFQNLYQLSFCFISQFLAFYELLRSSFFHSLWFFYLRILRPPLIFFSLLTINLEAFITHAHLFLFLLINDFLKANFRFIFSLLKVNQTLFRFIF